MKQLKKCKICNGDIKWRKSVSQTQYSNQKYCSRNCFYIGNTKERPTKICDNCGKTFEKRLNTSKKQWIEKKYCSMECKCRSQDGKEAWNKGKICEYQRNEKHYAWKEIGYSYFGLHAWVRRKLGSPNKCQYCGDTKEDRKIYWANIDHSYKRNLIDWIPLCASCHKLYDLKKINLEVNYA
jgi:hypothetical protein